MLAKATFFTPLAENKWSDTGACAWGDDCGAGVRTALRWLSYPLHPDTAPLQGVSNKRWLLGQRRAVAVTSVQLQEKSPGKLIRTRVPLEGTLWPEGWRGSQVAGSAVGWAPDSVTPGSNARLPLDLPRQGLFAPTLPCHPWSSDGATGKIHVSEMSKIRHADRLWELSPARVLSPEGQYSTSVAADRAFVPRVPLTEGGRRGRLQ